MAHPSDVHLGEAQAGLHNYSLTATTSYVKAIPENASRRSYCFQNQSATVVTVRLGLTGPEYILTQNGSFARTAQTGSVFSGDIYVKGASGGEVVVIEEA